MVKQALYHGLLSALLLIGLSQCQQGKKTAWSAAPEKTLQAFTYQQALMGTRFFITLYAEEKPQADIAAKAAFQYAADVNSTCSDYDTTSELMKLNAAPTNQPVTLSPMLFTVLSTGLIIAEETKGSYDPTLGWHSYNWRMARRKGVLPPSEKIAASKESSGWKHLKIDRHLHTATKQVANMRLDLGGIAKGYAADGMLQILNDHGISRASITAGGEVRLGDPPPDQVGWKVSLKTLDANQQLSPSTIMLSNCAISTSGDLHQSTTINGQRYSHIVNPTTGLGLTERVSATVIGSSCTQTDALATALCVDPSIQVPNFKTLIILEQQDGTLKVIKSKNWH